MIQNILTFDIEDWFHILDLEETANVTDWHHYDSRIHVGLEKILSACSDANVHGTFFILGWIAKKYPRLINEIANLGHEIACHSNEHPLVYEIGKNKFKYDTLKALEHINNACGIIPTIYRAPGFSITNATPWAYEVLSSLNFTVDCSIFPMQRGHGGYATYKNYSPHLVCSDFHDPIVSMPVSIANYKVFRMAYSGGGYFRLLPYSLIKLIFSMRDYNMTYFHPRDFDAEQPYLEGLSRIRKFKSYVGLKHSEEKFRKLLSDFQFLRVTDYLSQTVYRKYL
ncbi:polysaccharide deacetylase family protein [Planktomarina temperata]|nr:polysaccharide deacetylase family protein [Planktomarina temperata]